MRSARQLLIGFPATIAALAWPASEATAQAPEFVELGHGSFPSLNATWQGLADDRGKLLSKQTNVFTNPF